MRTIVYLAGDRSSSDRFAARPIILLDIRTRRLRYRKEVTNEEKEEKRRHTVSRKLRFFFSFEYSRSCCTLVRTPATEILDMISCLPEVSQVESFGEAAQ